MLMILCYLCIGCNKDEEISQFKTYTNDYYTIQYPSNWKDPELNEQGDFIVSGDKQSGIWFKLETNRQHKGWVERYI